MCYLLLQKTVVLSECSSFSENKSKKTWIKSLSGKFFKLKCIKKTNANFKSASFYVIVGWNLENCNLNFNFQNKLQVTVIRNCTLKMQNFNFDFKYGE